MRASVLFLEPNSGHLVNVDKEEAIQTAKTLIRVLRLAYKVNRKLTFNTTDSLANSLVAPNWTLSSVLGGANFREEWQFLRSLVDRSPFSTGFESLLNSFTEIEVKTGGISSQALVWAHIVDTGIVSFHVSSWQSSWIGVQCISLDDKGETISETRTIRNFSCNEHVKEHKEWLHSLGYVELPTVSSLWEDREHLFPGLRILDRVKKDLESLETSGAPYFQAVQSLKSLSNDSINWKNGIVWPEFSTKVTPESESRQKLCFAFDTKTNNKVCFHWHARFTGGVPGRIHFQVDNKARNIVVAYIGYKLLLPIE